MMDFLLVTGGQTFCRARLIKRHYTSKVSQLFGFYAQTDNLTSIQYFGILVNNPYEGFYNFSDICVPVDLFTPSLYKFDVTGKDIEDNHIMEHEHKKENYSIYR